MAVKEDEMEKDSRVPQDNELAGAFVAFFYPIHYQFGKALEDVMRDRRLTRKQVAILWIIHAEGMKGRRMLRKELEHLIQNWFEISRPAMTQTLRAMARPPLRLVRLTEAPNSGREQMVSLTVPGERCLEQMIERAKELIKTVIAGLPEDDLRTLLSLYQLHLPRALKQLHKASG